MYTKVAPRPSLPSTTSVVQDSTWGVDRLKILDVMMSMTNEGP